MDKMGEKICAFEVALLIVGFFILLVVVCALCVFIFIIIKFPLSDIPFFSILTALWGLVLLHTIIFIGSVCGFHNEFPYKKHGL